MKRRIKRMLKNNAWVFIALIDMAMIAMFLYMMFCWFMDIAVFRAFMQAAGC